MKIGLNATCFNTRPSGANQRFFGIYDQLFKLMPDAEFVIYHSYDSDTSSWFDHENIRFIKAPISIKNRIDKITHGFFFWKSIFKKENFDLFESFNLPLAPVSNTIAFQTIHDIRSIALEDLKVKKLVSRHFHSSAIKKASRIITVSDSMKNEILNYFPNTSISRIYNGINVDSFRNLEISNLDALRTRLSLPKDFLLSVGHFENRKNYSNLIHAIHLLKERGFLCSLVIIGNDNGSKYLLEKQIKSLGLGDHVKLFSNIGFKDFQLIYRMCKFFIFPSLYEGFGIPILESMASGKSMALSNLSVFQEITEGKYFYFDPLKPESIALSIIELFEKDYLVRDSISYGYKRVDDFDFNNIARQLKKLYISHHE